MNDLLVLAAAGVGAWSMRASAIVLARGRTLPGGVTQALAYAKHAVLAGLVGAALATSASSATHVLLTPQALATTVAGAVAWRTRGVLRTLLAGVAAAALLSAAWPG
jgi:branched-subunit amino acid transport protein